MKKGEGIEKIIEAIQAGNDTPKKIRQSIGWIGRRGEKNYCYHKERGKKKGLIEEDEKGRLRILIEPENIADPKELKEVLVLVKSPSEAVRRVAIKELAGLSASHTITELSAYEFIVNAIPDPDYEDHKATLFTILFTTLNKVRGTRFEAEIFDRLKKKTEILRELALKNESTPVYVRHQALRFLGKIDEEAFFEVILAIIVRSEKSLLFTKNSSGDLYGGREWLIVGGELNLFYLECKNNIENFKNIRKKLRGILRKYQKDKEMIEKIEFVLDQIREMEKEAERVKYLQGRGVESQVID